MHGILIYSIWVVDSSGGHSDCANDRGKINNSAARMYLCLCARRKYVNNRCIGFAYVAGLIFGLSFCLFGLRGRPVMETGKFRHMCAWMVSYAVIAAVCAAILLATLLPRLCRCRS